MKRKSACPLLKKSGTQSFSGGAKVGGGENVGSGSCKRPAGEESREGSSGFLEAHELEDQTRESNRPRQVYIALTMMRERSRTDDRKEGARLMMRSSTG
jgi:hypothetical protein